MNFQLKFSEFGTRRRYSAATHDKIVELLKENVPFIVPEHLICTSQ